MQWIKSLLNELNDENKELDTRLTKYIVDYNGLNCEWNWLKTEKEQLENENKELKHENVNIMSDLDYFRAKSGSCEEGLFQKDKEIAKLEKENRELQAFKDKVFNSIDKTIKSETQIAENIESTIEGDYVKAVNRLIIIAFKNLKEELSE